MIRHHSKQQVDAARREHPDSWICEVVSNDTVYLLAIPSTEDNAKRPLAGFGGLITGDQLDGACIRSPKLHAAQPTEGGVNGIS